MKKVYVKPQIEIIPIDPRATMMAESVYIEVEEEEEPAEPDAPKRRGEWGNLWAETPMEEEGGRW